MACSESDNSHNLPNNNSNNTSNNATTTSNSSTNNDSIGTNNSSTTNETSGTVGPDDFDVLREVKSALELSPDQRTRRAHELVETGDLAQIFEFVRDEIRVTPVSRLNQRFEPMASRSLDDPSEGWRAALRASVKEALLEAAYFEESTISLLDQETLEALPAEDLNERVEGLPNAANWLHSAESFDDDWTLVNRWRQSSQFTARPLRQHSVFLHNRGV